MADTLLNYELLPFRDLARLRVDSVSRGGRRNISQTGSRAAQRAQRDSRPFAVYECTCVALNEREKNDLKKFWEAHQFDTNQPVSDADAFLFLDDTDPNEHELDDVSFGTGDGSETVFQISTPIAYTDRDYTRPIRQIKEGSETITNGGTETTAYDIDYNTGVVTFDTAPSNNNDLRVTCEYYKKVIFQNSTWNESLNGVKWDVSFSLREVK